MSITLHPLSAHVGAEVRGLDLTKDIDETTADSLRHAFREHHLLLVRQTGVSSDDQIRFARLFGEVTIRVKPADAIEAPMEQYVSNTRVDGILGDGEIEFHHDHVFFDEPLRAIILYGIEIPPTGSATKFRNAIALFDSLPRDLQQRCEAVRCLHLFDYSGDFTRWQDPAKASPDAPRAWQPLVWTSAETGQKALWLSPINTVDFEGVSREEGMALIRSLRTLADGSEQFVYRHKWTPGDLVIWSNRTLQHARLPFDPSERRTLRRTPIL